MGRLVFAASPTGSATAATQTKYASASIVSVKLRLDVAFLQNIPVFTEEVLVQFPDKNNLRLCVSGVDTGQYRLLMRCNTHGAIGFGDVWLKSALPSSGTDVVLYWQAQFASVTNGLNIAVLQADGTQIESQTFNAPGTPSDWTNAGTGALTVWNMARAGDMAGMGVYGGTLSGTARGARPATGDTNVLGVYYFAEGTGSSTADATGGTSLAVTNGTLNSVSDPWDPAGTTARFRPYFITG